MDYLYEAEHHFGVRLRKEWPGDSLKILILCSTEQSNLRRIT